MRILVVEDEAAMARSLTRGLEAEGYTVDVAADGEEGLQRGLTGSHDAVILDLMLPKLSGYEVVSQLRAAGVRVPVLMLTAKQGEFDQTESLDSGADDFLSKPFSYPVLLARLRALIRRGGARGGAVLEYGDLRLDTANHRCWRGEEEVPLTRRELSLLAYLLHRPEQPVSKAELLDHVWDPTAERDPNVVEVYIGYLRRKLDQPGRPSHVETVRSLGYRLVPVPVAAGEAM
ncbi:MAG TPA: response regulator transcription factor [Acidimicrobiales bacterium]|nr:response regulator transcription factor [Acidimicrobiales bacterium]